MSTPSELTPGTWPIDATHTTVGFVARHLMVTKVRGSFKEFTGNINVGATPAESSVEVTVQLASVDTGDKNRDGHLVTGDFFDVEKFPTMEFKSTSIKGDGEDYKMTGDLTIHGVTQPIELDVEFAGVSGDPWGGTRAGFSATGEISRKEWGLEYNAVLETGGVVISDKIKLELEVEAVKPV